MFIKTYSHDPILMRQAKFGYKRKLPLDMTGNIILIPANCTGESKHPPLCSLFDRFQEEHLRSNVLFHPVFVSNLVTLPDMFVLFFPRIS